MNTHKIKMFLGAALIFFAGAFIGIVGTSIYIKKAVTEMRPGFTLKTKNRILNRLNRRLKLSTEQKSKIEPILSDATEELGKLRKEHRQKVSKLIHKNSLKIEEVLDADQKPKFQRMYKRAMKRSLFGSELTAERKTQEGKQVQNQN